MVAFASNSILCRLALAPSSIDPASFTGIRISSGAAALALIAAAARRSAREKAPHSRAGWMSAFFLFLYAIAFSWSYVSLSAGTGALILFGCLALTELPTSHNSPHTTRAECFVSA
jgi:drug/metabolite transporter (DMT)-like permease